MIREGRRYSLHCIELIGVLRPISRMQETRGNKGEQDGTQGCKGNYGRQVLLDEPMTPGGNQGTWGNNAGTKYTRRNQRNQGGTS